MADFGVRGRCTPTCPEGLMACSGKEDDVSNVLFTPRPMIAHPRPESAGNRALLVLVNSLGSFVDRCANTVSITCRTPLNHRCTAGEAASGGVTTWTA
jgi:hypothetical protein